MKSENEECDNKENIENVIETDKAEKPKKEKKEKKELTPQEIQRQKKMLVYPLFFLIFLGAMWIIFAPSSDKDVTQHEGFNAELPVPKDDVIVGDKRTAYEQQAMIDKQEEKKRSLQDFAFTLGEEESGSDINTAVAYSDYLETQNNAQPAGKSLQSSTYAYHDVNRQLDNWYRQPETNRNEQEQLEMEWRIEELERKLCEAENAKSVEERQLEMIEKSYQIAAKYSNNGENKTEVHETETKPMGMNDKVIPKPVSQVDQNVVSILAKPMSDEEFMEQYSENRNMGFITATDDEAIIEKNAIRASVYKTVVLSDGKELQLRLLEPMRAGHLLIPANTTLAGSAKINGERLLITITSIQYAGNLIPVELIVHDMDGMPGIFVPNSTELNAVKEIAANMGTQMGSSITITDNAGSQLAADLGRSAIQGASQYIGKKMREVKVTLKANYKVLLLPKV